jgi:hypothetical protein
MIRKLLIISVVTLASLSAMALGAAIDVSVCRAPAATEPNLDPIPDITICGDLFAGEDFYVVQGSIADAPVPVAEDTGYLLTDEDDAPPASAGTYSCTDMTVDAGAIPMIITIATAEDTDADLDDLIVWFGDSDTFSSSADDRQAAKDANLAADMRSYDDLNADSYGPIRGMSTSIGR